MTDNVKQLLSSYKVDQALIPGGCTKYLQASNICWNSPFKAAVTEQYDEWLAEGIHEYTEAGNMKAPPRRLIVQWILTVWKGLSESLIKKSFRCCALTVSNDGSEDGRPCEMGKAC